jgi:hypothetical protein
MPSKTSNNTVRVGKSAEYRVVGLMLKEGLDVFLPAADCAGVDAVVRRPDGRYAEVQIKARAKDVKHPAGFTTGKHEQKDNYWFIFLSEEPDAMFVMSSEEFVREASLNEGGKNKGARSLFMGGTSNKEPYIKDRYKKYAAKDFSRILE